ncbi:MAG TPA: pilus assembly protein HicB [Clostridiales bacterium]|nr:MAG: pilus assembly protein HicB [Clostridiales bacterium GWD2_32_59]HAN10645.1 pilus assembly protein HicB [Clostridiales bacterium]
MKDNYIYPAVFTYGDDGITVEFPDLPGCITCGGNEEEALHMAKDAMGGYLSVLEDQNKVLPNPSKTKDVTVNKEQVVTLIEVYMIGFRSKIKYHSVKKTLTLPYWLNKKAEESKVNFSQILQEGLKSYLGL